MSSDVCKMVVHVEITHIVELNCRDLCGDHSD